MRYCEAQVTIDGETLYCEAEAPIRVAGERDSFGTEWIWFCESCYPLEMAEWRAERNAEAERRAVGVCHGEQRTDLRATSVWRENPWEEDVYACPDCIARAYRDLNEEMDYLDRLLARH